MQHSQLWLIQNYVWSRWAIILVRVWTSRSRGCKGPGHHYWSLADGSGLRLFMGSSLSCFNGTLPAHSEIEFIWLHAQIWIHGDLALFYRRCQHWHQFHTRFFDDLQEREPLVRSDGPRCRILSASHYVDLFTERLKCKWEQQSEVEPPSGLYQGLLANWLEPRFPIQLCQEGAYWQDCGQLGTMELGW